MRFYIFYVYVYGNDVYNLNKFIIIYYIKDDYSKLHLYLNTYRLSNKLLKRNYAKT